MKIHVILFLALLFLTSFQDKDMSDKKLKNIGAENPTLIGTWELISRYNYKDNNVVDTFYVAESYRQVKMFTATKVMWSRKMRSDSTEWFGFGTYKLNATRDTLREVLDYGSSVMSKLIEDQGEFVFELQLNGNSYIQIEFDQDGNRVISENYSRIE
ncbi:MAG TPA: hypothetical protein VGA80_09980 [Flavobacteriaceae bacterium]|jgi:hypothetical protein